MAAPFIAKDGEDANGVRAEVWVQTGTGTITDIERRDDEGQKNAWEDFIVKDLIGHVDATYRTIARREGRAINGLSMGGYGGLTVGLRHPDLFCSIGSQYSSSISLCSACESPIST